MLSDKCSRYALLYSLGLAACLILPTRPIAAQEQNASSGNPVPLAAGRPRAYDTYIDSQSTMDFDGHTYSLAEAVPVLIGLATEHGKDESRRAVAVDRLNALAHYPLFEARIPELVRATRTEHDNLMRAGLLMSLAGVDDPDVLGYFEDVLRANTDPFARFLVAEGLARWNVPSGIRELIRLLATDDMLGDRYVAGEALMALERWNQTNGWGAVIERDCALLAEGEKPSRSAALAEVRAAWTTWLDANEARFPKLTPELRDHWRTFLVEPRKDQPAAREELKKGVAKLFQRLLAGQPDPRAASAAAREALHAAVWARPIDQLAPAMLNTEGQRWYLDSVAEFYFPKATFTRPLDDAGLAMMQRTRSSDQLERLQVTVPRLAARRRALAEKPLATAERSELLNRLVPAVSALETAWLEAATNPAESPANAKLGVELAQSRFLIVATSAFFCGHTLQLQLSADDWTRLARRTVTDWRAGVPVTGEAFQESAPRLGEALFWATMDDPDASFLYRAALRRSDEPGVKQ